MDRDGKSTTNHPGIIDYKGSSHFFYHNDGLPGESSFHRSVCEEKFTHNTDGMIPKISKIITGVGNQTTPRVIITTTSALLLDGLLSIL